MSQTNTIEKPATSVVPSQATFDLVLSKTISGKSVIQNAKCVFNYIWDFNKNVGLAHLVSIDGCNVNITLHPIGIAGMLGFMSDMAPTGYVINGQRVVLYRVILDIYLKDGVRAGAIMFNQDGSTIETSDTWRASDSAGLAH